MDGSEIAALVVSATLLISYNVLALSTGRTVFSAIRRFASAWTTRHLSKADAPTVTLAVQTLRNSILVAVFVGGLSFQYALTSLAALRSGSASPAAAAGTIIVAALLFLSFLSFANAIRYASHAG
jgi:hypothetical protein